MTSSGTATGLRAFGKLLYDEAALVAATTGFGFSEPVARAGLAAELAVWTDAAIVAEVAQQMASVPDKARWPKAVLVIAARTSPASTIRQVFAGRVMGARVLVKAAAGQEPIAQALANGDPTGIAAVPFGSSDTEAIDAAIAEADAVVVLGTDATVSSVRQRVRLDKAFVGHGHRASAAWLPADAPDADFRGLAADLCAWDQAGCLAPQCVWVEGDVTAFAGRLLAALPPIERELPSSPPAASLHARRTAGALAVMAGGRTWSTATAVLATHPDATFRATPGQRFLWLLPASEGALRAAEPHLTTLAVLDPTNPPVKLHPQVRLCIPGMMQRPALDWRQDGLPLFASLIPPR
ncbi:MAG: acyl-CoA reductase [Myxococcota bacterium]